MMVGDSSARKTGGGIATKHALILVALTALPLAAQTAPHSRPPRRLPDSLKQELAACFAKKPGSFSIMAIADDPEAFRYAQDWRDVLISAGWKTDDKEIPIQSFRFLGSEWTGMRVRVHDSGQTALTSSSPEQNFAACVNGRLEIPTGGRIIRYKDIPSGSITIQVSQQPE